jgi:hypothetical protein
MRTPKHCTISRGVIEFVLDVASYLDLFIANAAKHADAAPRLTTWVLRAGMRDFDFQLKVIDS